MGAQVLPAVGCHGGSQSIGGTAEHLVDFAPCRQSVYISCTQGVYRRLKRDASNGRDKILQRHGKAVGEKMERFPFSKLELAGLEVENGQLLFNIEKAQSAGDPLGEIRRPGRARNAHVKYQNKHKIQHHIDARSHCKKQHGALAVAHSADHGGCHIIEHHKGDAPENAVDVVIGVGEGLGRRVHGCENVAAEHQHHRHDHRRGDGAEIDAVCHIPPKLRILSRAKGIGRRNAKAHAQANTRAQHHKVQRARGAHAAQGIQPHKFSHNHGIHQVINLLQYQTQQNGNGKLYNDTRGIAPCQVSCHRLHRLSYI